MQWCNTKSLPSEKMACNHAPDCKIIHASNQSGLTIWKRCPEHVKSNVWNSSKEKGKEKTYKKQ